MKILKYFSLLVFVSLLFTGTTVADAIRGKMPLAPGSEVRLYSMKLHRSELIATARTEKDSIFKLPMPANSYHGFYLLRWSGGETELLFDGKMLSLSISARGEVTVVRGEQWQQYLENRTHLLDLRHKQWQLDSLLRATPADAFGYGKIKRKYNRNQRQVLKLRKKLEKNRESLSSRILLFEFSFQGYTPELFADRFKAEEALNQVSLADTLSLHHNRWPHFMRLFVAAYAPAKLSNVDSALLHCSNLLVQKAKQHPAFLEGSLNFLQMGMQALEAAAAQQFLRREKNLFAHCFDPRQDEKQRIYVQKLENGAPLPAIEGLEPRDNRLLVFWSAECMPCLQELTDLHLWLKNNRPDVQVTAIALNAEEAGWMAEKQAFDSWQHLRDAKAWDGIASEKLGVNQVPYYLQLDGNGQLVARFAQTSALRRALEQ